MKRTTREKSADFSVPRKKQSFFLWKCGVSNPALHNNICTAIERVVVSYACGNPDLVCSILERRIRLANELAAPPDSDKSYV